MPRPVEDRSDVGGAAQFNNIGPVPLSAFSKPGQSLTGVLSALLSVATPLETAEESRFLVRTVTRSRTFKPFWHMLLWPDSQRL